MIQYNFILNIAACLLLTFALELFLGVNGRRSGSSRSGRSASYSRYSYRGTSTSARYTYSSNSGYSRYSYRYSSSHHTYTPSSIRYSYTYTPTIYSYYSSYVPIYYYFYSYYTYSYYYGGSCYYSSNSGYYCSTTTTTTPTPTTQSAMVSSSTCGSTASMGTEMGSFTSHRNQDGVTVYSNNMNCYWLISVASGKKVALRFSYFDTEKTHDTVRIHDGPNLNYRMIDIYYGSTSSSSTSMLPPTVLYSTGNSLLVRFTTDSAVVRSGFQAYYQVHEDSTTNSPTTISTVVTNSSTSITTTISPNNQCTPTTHSSTSANGGTILSHSTYYSQDYPNQYTCTWNIVGRPGYKVKLWFLFSELESCYDKLIIYDGSSSTNPILGTYCSAVTPNPNVYSTGQSMYLRFTTDSSVTKRGFMLMYSLEIVTATTTVSPAMQRRLALERLPPDQRNRNSSEVCVNYNVNANGSAMGAFTCPNPWEPDDFTQCCGETEAEYCCRLEDNTPMVVGIIVGIICAVITAVVLLVCCIRCCNGNKFHKNGGRYVYSKAKFVKFDAKKTWRQGIFKTRAISAWKRGDPYDRFDSPDLEHYPLPVPPPPSSLYSSNYGNVWGQQVEPMHPQMYSIPQINTEYNTDLAYPPTPPKEFLYT